MNPAGAGKICLLLAGWAVTVGRSRFMSVCSLVPAGQVRWS
jgi:hypothetical protein